MVWPGKDKSWLLSMIPLPALDSNWIGLDDSTLLVRFRTFYLKLTYDGANDAYRVEGYLFNVDIPKLNLLVPRLSIEGFLAQFDKDNYLAGPFKIDWPIKHDLSKRH